MSKKEDRALEKRLKAELIDAAQRVEVNSQKLEDILRRAREQDDDDK